MRFTKKMVPFISVMLLSILMTLVAGLSVNAQSYAIAQGDEPITPPPEVLPESGQYPPPPEVYADEAPQFLYSPELNLYVAVGVPYDLVYTGSGYFCCYGGRWYMGPYYNGPWVLATRRYFPPVLLRYRIKNIRNFRDMESRRYEHDRAHYSGRVHRPQFRGKLRR